MPRQLSEGRRLVCARQCCSRVDPCRADVGVTEQFLHGADVIAVFKQVRGKRVAQSVAADAFGDPAQSRGVGHRALNDGLVEVKSARWSPPRVAADAAGGEDELPRPRAAGVRILHIQRVGQHDTAQPACEVVEV